MRGVTAPTSDGGRRRSTCSGEPSAAPAPSRPMPATRSAAARWRAREVLARRRIPTQARLPSTSAPTAASRTVTLSTPSSLRPDASSRIARTRRMTPPGARVEIWAPIQAPGSRPAAATRRRRTRSCRTSGGPAAADAHERDRLDQVRAHQRRGLERRVEHQQPHHDDRAGAHRREAHQEPGDRAQGTVGTGRDDDGAGGAARPATPRRGAGCGATSGSGPATTSPAVATRSATPRPRLSHALEIHAGRHEADEPRAGERRRHGAHAQPARRASG